MKKIMYLKTKAFTLIEMLIVLVIISALLLLFVPNLSQQKEKVAETGNAAVIKVVESQAELYNLHYTEGVSLSQLVEKNFITEKQSQSYKEYYEKHTDETPKVTP